MDFSQLQLIPPLLRAVADEGYTRATPIQQQAIPHVLQGRDLLGLAQTGTGKTAAFALPILQRLAASPRPAGPTRPIRVLITTPTRELASQIAESFNNYGRHLDLTCGVVFGGVGMNPQENMLRRGVDVLVATPGRLLDHLGRNIFKMDRLEVFVLDEADQMLDMGFEPAIRRILKEIPAKRQTLFFSATMPTHIRRLADAMLTKPVEVAVVPESTAAERVTQAVYHVPSSDKKSLLVHLLADRDWARVLVFTRTKHGANRLAAHLNEYGSNAAAIHGNKSQGAREKALDGFKDGSMRVLVATDIAARGLDIDDVTHVVNYELPNVPETYVHRIGRTARAGASGVSVSLCAPDEKPLLADIEKAMRAKVPVAATPAIVKLSFTESDDRPERQDRGGRRGGRSGGGGGGGRGDGERRGTAAQPAQKGATKPAPVAAKPQGRGGASGGGAGGRGVPKASAGRPAAQNGRAQAPQAAAQRGQAPQAAASRAQSPQAAAPAARAPVQVVTRPAAPQASRRQLPGESLSGQRR
jgi:ATP-dependent RNA helicase RhlE